MSVKVVELFEYRLQKHHKVVSRLYRIELRAINLPDVVPVSLLLIEVSVIVCEALPKMVKVFFVLLACEVCLRCGNGFHNEAQQDDKSEYSDLEQCESTFVTLIQALGGSFDDTAW